jgi:methyl-accepting chemotaxis protein
MEKILSGSSTAADLKFITTGNIALLQEMNKAVGMMQKQSEARISQLLLKQTILVCIGIGFALFSFWVILYVTNSIGKIIGTMGALEAGDMTARSPIKTKDEIGQLAKAANKLASQFELNLTRMRGSASTTGASTKILHTLVKDLSTTAGNMATNATNVAHSAEEMNGNMAAIAAASEETSINVSQVAAGAEEMSATISEIAGNSEEAIRITEGAVTEAASAEESVRALGVAAQKISKVTESINEIADQTNLLALNATIEAARAGEAGKGFAVVANEIKELAKQTTEATQEIKDRINGVRTSSEQTIGVINVITNTINKTNEIVLTMATAVQEQAAASREISDNVSQASVGIQEVNENIAQASTVNSGVASDVEDIKYEAQDLAAHSSDLYELASEQQMNASAMEKQVARFTFQDELFQIGKVKAAHFEWKMKLSSVIAGYEHMNEQDVVDHHQCAFGKWYDNVPEVLRNSPVFAELGQHHKAVHTKIREAVAFQNQQNTVAAKQKIGEFENERKQLFRNLDELYVHF